MRKRRATREASSEPYSARVQPSLVDTVRLGAETIRVCAPSELSPHRIEQEVQRHLLSHPELRFSTLVIRRTQTGVCLEGVLELEADDDCPDVCNLARSVAGVNEVLNHLVVRRPIPQG